MRTPPDRKARSCCLSPLFSFQGSPSGWRPSGHPPQLTPVVYQMATSVSVLPQTSVRENLRLPPSPGQRQGGV